MGEENNKTVSVLIKDVDFKTKLRWDIFKAENQCKNDTEALKAMMIFYITNRKSEEFDYIMPTEVEAQS